MQTRRPFALADAKPRYAPDRPARVDHIKLELRFDFRRKILYGRCATTFTAVGGDLKVLEMDASQLHVKRAASADGKPLSFDSLDGKVRVGLARRLKRGASTTIIIDYEAHQPRQGIYFIGPDKAYRKRPVQVWTQGQDEDAHYWFPCIDHPNAKATSEVVAIVPQDFFVLSNGELVSTKIDKRRQTKTYHWRMDVPHVTYLISVVAGRFVGRTDMVDGLPVSYYVEPGREEDGARSFGKTPKMVEFFGGRLKFKYPYAGYAQIAVADFVFGGMENTTATTQTESTLHDARAHLDFSSDGLVAHELAHQWFGDLLTCKDWSHAWLNESFATYFEALFKEFDLGKDEFDYYRIVLADRYFKEDRERYRRPIVTNVYAEPVELFDRHLYEKGALVLHMVRAQLGDGSWWQAMHHYVQTYQRRNVETVDLARAIEEVTGRNFQPLFDQWVMKAGHPEFDVGFSWDESGKVAVVTVAQTQDASDQTPLFSVPIALEFRWGAARGKRPTVARYDVQCDAREQTFSFKLKKKPATFRFDPNGDILKVVRLGVPRAMLIRQLLTDHRVPGRVEAARELGKDGSPEAIKALGKALMRDRFWGVQAAAAEALGRTRADEALPLLARATKIKHPKARRAVVDALGRFHGDEALRALEPLLRRDASYLVEAAAAEAIGKARAPAAYKLLVWAVRNKESWNDVVRCGALAGLAELGDERAIGLCLEWTEYGKPQFARRAAAAALGKLGHGRKDVCGRLVELLNDNDVRMRLAAVDGLQELQDPQSVEALEHMGRQDVDGRLKSRCREAAYFIREHSAKPAEIKKLREDLETLREANRSLRARLDPLERTKM